MHEIIGEVAGAEGVGRAIADAAARHLRAGAAADGGVVSVPARARTLCAPAEFPDEAYFASLPHPMLAAPGATALKLPGLPMATRLAAAQPCEDLRFDAAAPALRQEATLTFVAERAGELRGLALHNEVFVADGELAAPEISSADPGSHWPHVLLMLQETAQLAAATRSPSGTPSTWPASSRATSLTCAAATRRSGRCGTPISHQSFRPPRTFPAASPRSRRRRRPAC